MDALPKPKQDKYIVEKIAPQIQKQMKDIDFDNEDEKTKVYDKALSIKTEI